ncbi:hypothetical protein FCV25MIE_11827 [Fagus crenata]
MDGRLSVLRQEDQPYGAWLRANGSRPYRKVEIHVAGRSQNDGGAAKASGGATAAMKDNPPAGRVPTNVSVRQENEEAENPGSPIKTPDLAQSDRRSFEERLKEIDKEMGFLNENLGDLKVQEKYPCPSDTASKESENPGSIDISPRQGGRVPFKEVSKFTTH